MTAFLSVFRVIIVVILKQQLPLLSPSRHRLMSSLGRLFKKKKMDEGVKEMSSVKIENVHFENSTLETFQEND